MFGSPVSRTSQNSLQTETSRIRSLIKSQDLTSETGRTGHSALSDPTGLGQTGPFVLGFRLDRAFWSTFTWTGSSS